MHFHNDFFNVELLIFRYPNDTYDRIWWTHNFEPLWLRINTSETIQIIRGDAFKVPSIVMSSAVTPSNNTILEFYWDSQSGFVRPSYCIYMHFAEFDYLPPNRTRLIDVIMNGQVLKRNFQPTYLLSTHIPLTYELGSSTRYQFNITKAADSILPPILNALEAYTTLSLPYLASDITDGILFLNFQSRANISFKPKKKAKKASNITTSLKT